MAASAFEALFHGDDNFDFEADPGAVVIMGLVMTHHLMNKPDFG